MTTWSGHRGCPKGLRQRSPKRRLPPLGRRWQAAAWDDSGVSWGGSPPGRRANGLRIVARGCRGIRRDRVVVASASCPSNSWIVRTATPAARRCVAKQWRSVWIPWPGVIPAVRCAG